MRALHTPQQETNVAYNPGVSYRGGEFIAQGISQAGNAITAGLQRYAQNREESAALDMSFQTRAQPLLEEMQKFSAKDGQVSPAAGLVDKGADWHKFSSSQKKAFLADVVIMGDKQDRARRQQQDDDFRKAAAKLQQDQFTQLTKNQADMLGVSRQGMALEGMRTLGGLYNQYRDDTRADAQAKLAAQIHADTVARFGRVEADRVADRNAYRSMLQFAQPMQPGEEGPMPSLQFNAVRAMQQTGGNIPPEDIAALEKMGRISRVGTMTDIAGDPSGKFLWQADNAGYRVPTGQGGTGADKPTITITEKFGDRTVARKVTEEQFAALPQPVQRDAILDGQIAELEAMEKRGAKKAELTDNGVSQPMFGGQPIGDLLARLRARRGGGAAAPGPAAPGPAAEKPITTKAEFDALPSGATYKGKDGRTYQKP